MNYPRVRDIQPSRCDSFVIAQIHSHRVLIDVCGTCNQSIKYLHDRGSSYIRIGESMSSSLYLHYKQFLIVFSLFISLFHTISLPLSFTLSLTQYIYIYIYLFKKKKKRKIENPLKKL
jgi:hypothetical protein